MSSIFLNVTEPQVVGVDQSWQLSEWIFSIAFLSCIFQKQELALLAEEAREG